MFAWTEQQLMIQGMIRDFVEKEIVPLIDDLEYNGLPPYDILRKLFKTFGMDELAGTRFDKQIEKEEAMARGEEVGKTSPQNHQRWRCVGGSSGRRRHGHDPHYRNQPSLPGAYYRHGCFRGLDRWRHYVQR